MTAINALRQRERAVIFTDTAGYTIDGIVMGFANKCIAIPGLRAAVACRGMIMATSVIATALGERFQRFDDIVEHGAEMLEEEYPAFVQSVPDAAQTDLDLVLAGWSEKHDAPVTMMLTSIEMHGVETWKWHHTDDLMVFPMVELEAVERQGFDMMAVHGPDDIRDPEAAGLAIIEAQRQARFDLAGEMRHIVGGAAVMTEITRDGVTQRIIRQWDDEIGEPIRPQPVTTIELPSNVTRLNRQQRRAAKKARRVAA